MNMPDTEECAQIMNVPVSLENFSMPNEDVLEVIVDQIKALRREITIYEANIAINARTKLLGRNEDVVPEFERLRGATMEMNNIVARTMSSLSALEYIYFELVGEEKYKADISETLPTAPSVTIKPRSKLVTPQAAGQVVGVEGVVQDENSGSSRIAIP